jgi:PTS system ascorbate-specific IIA component
MSVGILLVTHGETGACLLQAAEVIFAGSAQAPVETLAVAPETPPESICQSINQVCERLNQGGGVLILADLYGATPCNTACKVQPECPLITVAGLNLPMLLKVLTYRSLGLDALAAKAVGGGRDGILNASLQAGLE